MHLGRYLQRITYVCMCICCVGQHGITNLEQYGYKFVGDNVDKNIKPSYQRHEIRGQSLHHFQGYAVRDRLDLSHLSNQRPSFSMPDPSILYPLLQT